MTMRRLKPLCRQCLRADCKVTYCLRKWRGSAVGVANTAMTTEFVSACKKLAGLFAAAQPAADEVPAPPMRLYIPVAEAEVRRRAVDAGLFSETAWDPVPRRLRPLGSRPAPVPVAGTAPSLPLPPQPQGGLQHSPQVPASTLPGDPQ